MQKAQERMNRKIHLALSNNTNMTGRQIKSAIAID
jgi:hypothetical protein